MPANNPNTDLVVMTAVKHVMVPGSKLAAVDPTSTGGLGLVFIENKFGLMSQGVFPAAHISGGHQDYRRNSLRTYEGQLIVEVCYYMRWDQTVETIASIRADIAADLEILKGNLESDESLAYGANNYAVSIPRIVLSPWKGSEDNTFPGITVIKREMYLTINLLPYDC